MHSTSVFEHVIDQEIAFKEIYRVLKPDGVGLHNFPSKWRPIEPHIFVPLGSIFKSYWYFYIWALLGIPTHHAFQKDLTAKEIANRHFEYRQSGIKYLSDSELDKILSIYNSYSFEELLFIKYCRGRSRWLYKPCIFFPPLINLYHIFHTKVLVTKK